MSSSKDGYELNQRKRDGMKRVTEDNDCAAMAKESYKCLEKNQDNKPACNKFFLAYRDCKTKQTAERKRRNFERSGGNDQGLLESMKGDLDSVINWFKSEEQ